MIWGLKDDDPKAQTRNPFMFWQLWFAWYPVTLKDGRHAWLEYVEYRKEGHWSGYDTIYREAGKELLRIEEVQP